MAEMTLEKAECILAKARKWHYNDGLTDLQLARQLHNSLRNSAFSMAFFSLIFLKQIGNQNNDLQIATWGLGLTMIAFSGYILFQSSLYSKIRELFELSAPQCLEDLKTRSQPEPRSQDSQ